MQYDDISMLPPKMQEQARRKIREQELRRTGKTDPASVSHMGGYSPSRKGLEKKSVQASESSAAKQQKYGNQKTEVDGILFDSKKEAWRFLELREMETCGAIFDLRLQVNFTLVEGFTKPSGERVRPMVYKADFTYKIMGEKFIPELVVEDVKSRATRTKSYLMKAKLMEEKYRIRIREV